MHDIQREPTGEQYRQLLAVALSKCSIALLICNPNAPLSQYGKDAIAQLEPYLLTVEETDRWPGTVIYYATATVFTYRFDESSLQLLQCLTDHLYGWLQPDLPEDLCLLREDRSPWLVTISHEHDSYLLLSKKEYREIKVELSGLKIN